MKKELIVPVVVMVLILGFIGGHFFWAKTEVRDVVYIKTVSTQDIEGCLAKRGSFHVEKDYSVQGDSSGVSTYCMTQERREAL